MKDPGSPSSLLVPIHPAGWPFIAIFFLVTVVLGYLWMPLFWVGLLLTAWCAYFFRDPHRTTVDDPAVVTSPADGVVQHVEPRVPPPELEMGSAPLPCVGVFMNVFDVHVNRTPVIGRIAKVAYHKGKFLNASLDKASDENERQSFRIATRDGRDVGLVQIAGLVARRIIAFSKEGDDVRAGERVGLIRFGSKCDIYMPKGTIPLVLPGQRAVAGETVIALLDGSQTQRRGRTS
ncbi:MAG: phosphatidylserine decarboxylase [Geminicoccaceae bacterium]|nr:phosphatidylserine decarboxylase [Geminicoccaceae bacterium]